MHPKCWAERIAALETRMHELLVSLRILRTDLTVAQVRDESDSLLPNDSANELFQSINVALNAFYGYLEKRGAVDNAKPNLIRVYVSLPSEEASLRYLERVADILRELIEIMSHLIDERARGLKPGRGRGRIESGVRPIAKAAIEPHISWSRISPAPSVPADATSDDDARPKEERFVVHVQRLCPIMGASIGGSVDGNDAVKKAAG